ncbi:MAG: GNAT family N-acetyltransferase [Opitutales bacterium]
MKFREIDQDALQNTSNLWDLFAEIEAGDWYEDGNPEHRSWLLKKCAHRFGAGAQFYAVYSKEDTWIGLFSIVLHVHPKCQGWAEVLDLGVVEDQRRKGYALKILQYAKQITRDSGLCSLHVETYAEDTAALASYKRFGFERIAERPGVNGPANRGQVLLWKVL